VREIKKKIEQEVSGATNPKKEEERNQLGRCGRKKGENRKVDTKHHFFFMDSVKTKLFE